MAGNDQEQKHDLHHIDWPMFLSAEQRQKLLQDKINRAASYVAALEDCPAATVTRNFDVKSQFRGSIKQNYHS